MEKEKLLMLLSAICSALTLVIMPLMSAHAQPAKAPIKLSLVTFQPTGTIKTKMFLEAIRRINERTKGELVIECKGGPEVIPGLDQPKAVQKGIIDMALTATTYYKALVPEAYLVLFSRVTSKREREAGFYDLLLDIHKKAGLFYFGRAEAVDVPTFTMVSTVRVKAPSELAKHRLGISGPHIKAFPESLGMSLLLIPLPDSYTALERGLVDFYSTPWHTHVSNKLQEVCKYVIDHPYLAPNSVLIANLSTWEKLPKHLQKLVQDTYFEVTDEQIPQYLKIVEEARQVMRNAGVEFVKFSPADATWFIENLYKTEIEASLKDAPQYGPKLMELLRK